METVKAVVDGKEVDVVIKIDENIYKDDLLLKDDSKDLEDTIDLEEELSQTRKIVIDNVTN